VRLPVQGYIRTTIYHQTQPTKEEWQMARKPSETVQTSFRIKESLRRQIEQSAVKRGVSFNAEISMRMKESFDHEAMRTLTQAFSNLQKDVERVRSIVQTAEFLDQLVAVTTSLLATKCDDFAIVSEAKMILNKIAEAKRVWRTIGSGVRDD
jgi:hypothetical protein